ncbi:MAG: hypothetical protein ACREB5_05200 [Sphingomonadaceae bacterium]
MRNAKRLGGYMTGSKWTRFARALVLGGAFATLPGTAAAQEVVAATGQQLLAENASPFGAIAVSNEEAAQVAMPKLAFTPNGEDAKDFDKYYYFHRADTDFATAYVDISECDGYARGLSSGIAYAQVPYPYTYTMAGAVGGAIGNVMVQAIFGSAEKRRLRRVNMRKCMYFKGYERYGLAKELWEEFNFEEGLSGVSEKDRQRFLKQQALVAASAQPEAKGLGL